LIWRGHSTLIDEALRQTEFDSVVCAVGGGGLLAGIVAGLRRNGLDIPVFAVETEGAASLAAAMAAGAATTLPTVSTIATSLAARRVCDQGFKVTQTHDVRSVVVSDEAALRACLRFLDEERMLVEPACGAALAPLYEDIVDWRAQERPLIVVCGGNGVDLDLARDWRDRING
jgi:L-serine/L-threonine ammonia-lyase